MSSDLATPRPLRALRKKAYRNEPEQICRGASKTLCEAEVPKTKAMTNRAKKTHRPVKRDDSAPCDDSFMES